MRRALYCLLVLALVMSVNTRAQSPVIRQIIDSVSVDTMMSVIREMTGEDSTLINGIYQRILSRHALDPGNALAETYLSQKLESYGFSVAIQSHSAVGRSILVEQPGTVWPNRKFIICAHFDSMPAGPISPGGDDNGTGIAIVLEAARVLGKHSFPFTIVYALWDEEEVDPWVAGSTYYATNARAAGDSILGVINLDMCGYDGDSDGLCMVQGPDDVHFVHLRQRASEINYQYGIGLNVMIEPPWGDSDCMPFSFNGYDAIHLAEYAWTDRNPAFHTTYAYANTVTQPYFLKMAKLALGTLAFHALALHLDLIHSPLPPVVPRGAVTAHAFVSTGLQIGTGPSAPRMYYRAKPLGGNYGSFSEVVGTSGEGGTYSFTLPELPDLTSVQYYLAAQDANGTILSTSPLGGGGFTPPGNFPPGSFHEFVIGRLEPRWSDDASDLTHWTVTGGWALTAENFVSAPTSFTESPGIDSPPSAVAYLTSKDPIAADTLGRTFLEFDTQWAMQYGLDPGWVAISTDLGVNWGPLKGHYSYMGRAYPRPFSGGIVPIYGGVQSAWVHEMIDISSYAVKPFMIRFGMRTDTYISLDGWYIDNVKISRLDKTTGIKEEVSDYLPAHTSLLQNYPNPFNPITTIKYELSNASLVRLSVYDVLGREVSVLVNESRDAGVYEVKFDGSTLASGVYLYRLQAGDFVQAKRLVILK